MNDAVLQELNTGKMVVQYNSKIFFIMQLSKKANKV